MLVFPKTAIHEEENTEKSKTIKIIDTQPPVLVFFYYSALNLKNIGAAKKSHV
jgi:hypothetical protein